MNWIGRALGGIKNAYPNGASGCGTRTYDKLLHKKRPHERSGVFCRNLFGANVGDDRLLGQPPFCPPDFAMVIRVNLPLVARVNGCSPVRWQVSGSVQRYISLL